MEIENPLSPPAEGQVALIFENQGGSFMRTSASKMLDRALLLLFLTALLWIIFQRIYQNLPLSLLMSGISIVLLRALFLRIQHRLDVYKRQNIFRNISFRFKYFNPRHLAKYLKKKR